MLVFSKEWYLQMILRYSFCGLKPSLLILIIVNYSKNSMGNVYKKGYNERRGNQRGKSNATTQHNYKSNKHRSHKGLRYITGKEQHLRLLDAVFLYANERSFMNKAKNLFSSKKSAFTLAEVLITLGIIGVVVAMTLPLLINNVQDRIKQKRIENIKQKLSKATDKMAVQNGMIGYSDTMAFVTELKKNMKLAQICDNAHIAGCWPVPEVNLKDEGKTWEISKTVNAKTLKIPKDFQQDYADTVGILTADGTSFILSYNKKCSFDVNSTGLKFDEGSALSNSVSCLAGVFDWNGSNKPNKLGEDILTIGLAAGLGADCAIELGGKCFTAPKPVEKPLTKAECEAEKGKLGIKWCCSDDVCYGKDYWAGAVKQCGGVSKMPTLEDLGKLATELYGVQVGANQYVNGTLDTSKASSMGFTGWNFYVWSGEENGSHNAYNRYFNSSYTHGDGNGRDYSNAQAVCLGD